MNIEIMIAPGCREGEGGNAMENAEEKRRHICGCCGSNQNAARTMQPARQWNGDRGSWVVVERGPKGEATAPHNAARPLMKMANRAATKMHRKLARAAHKCEK